MTIATTLSRLFGKPATSTLVSELEARLRQARADHALAEAEIAKAKRESAEAAADAYIRGVAVPDTTAIATASMRIEGLRLAEQALDEALTRATEDLRRQDREALVAEAGAISAQRRGVWSVRCALIRTAQVLAERAGAPPRLYEIADELRRLGVEHGEAERLAGATNNVETLMIDHTTGLPVPESIPPTSAVLSALAKAKLLADHAQVPRHRVVAPGVSDQGPRVTMATPTEPASVAQGMTRDQIMADFHEKGRRERIERLAAEQRDERLRNLNRYNAPGTLSDDDWARWVALNPQHADDAVKAQRIESTPARLASDAERRDARLRDTAPWEAESDVQSAKDLRRWFELHPSEREHPRLRERLAELEAAEATSATKETQDARDEDASQTASMAANNAEGNDGPDV